MDIKDKMYSHSISPSFALVVFEHVEVLMNANISCAWEKENKKSKEVNVLCYIEFKVNIT